MQDYGYDTAATTSTSTGGTVLYLVIMLACLVFLVATLVAMWKVYVKAGKPGWAAFVPFYNLYVWLQIIGRPGWWLLLLFIPFVNIVISIIMSLDLAKSFGKSALFGVFGLILFSSIGMLILGFGKASYQGPRGLGAAPAQPAPPIPAV